MQKEYPLICRSIEMTEISIASLFNISIENLRRFLSTDYEEIYSNIEHHESDFKEFLYSKVFIGNSIAPNQLSRIHWFHGTRCFPKPDFVDSGILPLNQILERILKQIDQLASRIGVTFNVASTANSNHNITLFVEKTGSSLHWGPHGMLLRDALINPENYSSHDYLGIPEIIENYINSRYSQNSDALCKAYKKETHPYIIEFWTLPMDRQVDMIKAALLGLYYSYHKELPHDLCNTSYDGKGKSIPRNQIVRIECLK